MAWILKWIEILIYVSLLVKVYKINEYFYLLLQGVSVRCFNNSGKNHDSFEVYEIKVDLRGRRCEK